jgi:putative membrane protein
MFKHRVQLIVFLIASVVCSPLFAPAQANEPAGTPDTFLERALEMNYAEIHLAQLAATKAEDERVRAYGRTLVRDHIDAFHKLHGIRGQNGQAQQPAFSTATPVDRSMLTREHQEEFDLLSSLSGSAFDREFIDLMIRDHKTAIRLFEREAGISSDAERAPTGRITPGASDWPRSDDDDRPASTEQTAPVARELLPTLRMHLSEGERIQEELHTGRPIT